MKQKIFYLLVSLISLSGNVPAQTVAETHAYADSLYLAGNLDEALPAYQRIVFFNQPMSDADILYRLAECFLSGGDMEKALEYYDHSYFSQTNDSIKKEILFRKSACYLRSHNYNFALMELLNLEDSLSPGFEKKRNFYLGVTWFGLEDFSQSGEYFAKASEDTASQQKIREIFANPRHFSRPNPKAASWLSIFLPGSGQIYSGEIWSGINSLLLTGFFIGIGFYIFTVSSPLDAVFTALPWFQRYYHGGFQRAADIATVKRAENRSLIFDEILTIIASEK